MNTNTTNHNNKLIYPELSYTLGGICFEIHNALGRFAREKQYCDALTKKFQDLSLPFKREVIVNSTGNRLDFLIDNKIVLEVKAKQLVLKDDYYQLQRYLQHTGVQLGLLVNFRQRYLKPLRVIRIETDIRRKFQ